MSLDIQYSTHQGCFELVITLLFSGVITEPDLKESALPPSPAFLFPVSGHGRVPHRTQPPVKVSLIFRRVKTVSECTMKLEHKHVIPFF
jgi:hypothetical protein